MAEKTHRYGLTILNRSDEKFDFEGWRFGTRDIDFLDRALAYAVEGHRHTGEVVTEETTPSPRAELSAEAGNLPPGSQVFYRWALVDEKGHEDSASNPVSVRMPQQVQVPGQPRLTPSTESGALPIGQWTYAVSAYTGSSAHETPATASTSASLPATGSITVLFPVRPTGVTGWNVYRRGPVDEHLTFLGSTTDDSFVDDDTNLFASATRYAPKVNTTRGGYAVVVTLPIAELPAGYTWKLYRTYERTNWNNSLLAVVGATVDEVAYTDTGLGTKPGTPLLVNALLGGAPPIDIVDEAYGTMPPGRNVFIIELTFAFEDVVEPGYSALPWVCEFEQADILAVRAHLARDSTPSVQPLMATFERFRTDDTVWVELEDARCYIEVGDRVGPVTEPEPLVDDVASRYHFETGDMLRAAVTQSGEGPTPTDHGLILTVLMVVQYGSTTTTYVWSS